MLNILNFLWVLSVMIFGVVGIFSSGLNSKMNTEPTTAVLASGHIIPIDLGKSHGNVHYITKYESATQGTLFLITLCTLPFVVLGSIARRAGWLPKTSFFSFSGGGNKQGDIRRL